MDSLITAAAARLAIGDPLGALNLIALRNDAASLALRGIALAQLGDRERARQLLRAAARSFGPREAVARARCVVAEAEIALVSRDLSWANRSLTAARRTLEKHGDQVNAAHARYLEIGKLLLTGQIERAHGELERVPKALPLPLRVVHELMLSQIAMRKLLPRTARTAIARATVLASHVSIAALQAEVVSAKSELEQPVARLVTDGATRSVGIDEVAELLASSALVIDGCQHAVRCGQVRVSLAKKPILLALARALAEAWPGDVSRDDLVQRAFGHRLRDESHRARLRVDIGRLRRLLRDLLTITATESGFALAPQRARRVAVLLPPVDGEHAAMLALLADGEAWSTSAIALALGVSQRTAQRALAVLATDGKVESFGRGRSQRWLTKMSLGFTTSLLLPTALPPY
jgi:tetratricopeptide (TPR) repeat protein